jgi:hypothetical protein
MTGGDTEPAGPPRRLAAVLVPPGALVGQPPPGTAPTVWSRALIEDSYEVVAGLAATAVGLAATAADLTGLAELTWPGTVLIELATPAGAAGGGWSDGPALAAVDAVGSGCDVLVLLSPDSPDLPALHIGKLFQALEQAALAWVPVADGGVAAIGFTLPVQPWVRRLSPDFDGDPVAWAAAAPARHLTGAAPGWHRLRVPGDLRHLDPGLSGWETTRALLAGSPLS